MSRLLNNHLSVFLSFGLLALVGGCATTPPAPAPSAPPPAASGELGRANGIVVVVARSGESRASLAARYLGSALETQRVVALDQEEGSERPIRAGEAVAIALTPRDPGGALRHPVQSVPILCYHRFTDRSVSGTRMEVSAPSFEAQLRYLRDNNYSVIPLKRLIGFLSGRDDLPPKAVVLTVDDGYRSFYQVAFPLLQKYRVPATLFPYSNFIGAGDALTWTQLQALAHSGLVDVEAHSRSHSDLTLRQRGETAAAYRARLANELDIRQLYKALGSEAPVAFAYPYGAANVPVLEETARQSWGLGLTVLRGPNTTWSDPLLLNRDMVFGTDSLEGFARRLELARTPVGP